MPIRRQGGFSVRSRSALVALAVLALGAGACTPIEPVQHADAGATAGASKPGQCQKDADCPRSSACTRASCNSGACGEQPELDGVRLPPELQVVGDCNTLLCDGSGGTRTVSDDTDKNPGDGNTCHTIECHNGSVSFTNRPENTPCSNDAGVCKNGLCSVCEEGRDCSRPGDCTVHRMTCDRGCVDTGEPRATGACQAGKVCEDGRCVPCIVGAECEVDAECYIGITTSCEGGKQCEMRPVSGPECSMNSAGQRRFCAGGSCTLPCREGPCMSPSAPCHTSRWDCSDARGVPGCVDVTQPDGTACGDGATCHTGQCEHNALNNGNFAHGLSGWTATGDAATFMLASGSGRIDRPVLSTSADGKNSGGNLKGKLSQSFTVPSDALALRFVIWGGHAHVLLRDTYGNAVEDCVGLDSDSAQIPVSWDLSGRHGQTLTLSIEDDLASGDWAYVSVSGFDVIRDLDGPLRNPQFLQNWAGWETTGDATHFNLFSDYGAYAGSSGIASYGRRLSVSTYGRDSDAPYGVLTTGSLAQQFVVPNDAEALRFVIHGGKAARVALLSGTDVLHSVTGNDADDPKLPVSWPLVNERGKTLRLLIEDTSTSTPFGYIGTSGFDLITSYNGP